MFVCNSVTNRLHRNQGAGFVCTIHTTRVSVATLSLRRTICVLLFDYLVDYFCSAAHDWGWIMGNFLWNDGCSAFCQKIYQAWLDSLLYAKPFLQQVVLYNKFLTPKLFFNASPQWRMQPCGWIMSALYVPCVCRCASVCAGCSRACVGWWLLQFMTSWIFCCGLNPPRSNAQMEGEGEKATNLSQQREFLHYVVYQTFPVASFEAHCLREPAKNRKLQLCSP